MNKSILSLLIISIFSLGLNAQTVHLTEDFNAGSLPAGWSTTAITGTNVWSFALDGSGDEGGVNNLNGSGMAIFDDGANGSSSTNDFASLTSASFNNVANGATFLEFDYNFRQESAVPNDSFYVEVFDGTNWNFVFGVKIDDCGNYSGASCAAGLPHANINISAFANANCQVRFVYFDGNDWGWYVNIDNVLISSPLADDIGVTSIISPESTCGLGAADSVKVRIFNYGANAASGFPVSYSINGGTPVTETVTASVPVNDSLDYVFATTANFSAITTYNIESYTSYVLDGSPSNDTSNAVVENFPAYTPNYSEGFEAGLGGWSFGGVNSSWARGLPTSPNINSTAGGSNSIVTNLSGSYNNNENSQFISPCFDFSGVLGDPEVRFSLNYRTENPFDRLWLEVSTDDGLTWTKVGAAAGANNWYNNTGLGVWTGNSNGWINVKNKLTGTAGFSKVLVRFVYNTDGSVAFDGVGIDNFGIIGPQAVDVEMFSLIDPVASAPCGFGSSQQVTVRIFNNGASPITTFDAGYRVNNGAATLQNGIVPPTPIAAGSFYDHTFSQTTNLSGPGFYSIDLWAEVAGDNFQPNDSLNNVQVRNASIPISFFSNFENDAATGGAINTTNDGWVQTNPSATVTWRMNSGGTSSFATGPTGDHTTGNGNYAYIETSTGTSAIPAELVSPCLNLGNNLGANLSFWYHMHGATIGNLVVDVFDGTSWTTLRTISGQQQPGQGDPWREEIVSLSAYAGASIQIRFSANRTTSFTGDIAIDDILVFEPIPQDAQMGGFLAPTEGCGLSSNSTMIVEVENFGTTLIAPDSIYMYYQVDNLTPVKDTLNVGIPLGGQVTHTFTVGPNLSTSGQTYNLKAWCELNGDSNIGNDTTYLTVTNNVKTLSFSEDFQTFGNQTSSTGWTFSPNTQTGVYWRSNVGATGSGNTGPNGDHTTGSGRYVYLETSGNGGPAFLISPCVDLTNVNGAVLNFWYHKFGAGMNDLFVDVFDNSTGVWVNNIGVVRGQTQTSGIDPWQEAFVGLSAYAGKQINFRFRGLDDASGFTGDMAIDDILVFEPIPQDAKVDSLISPESGCDLTPNELICVNVENFGTQDITAMTIGYSSNNGAPRFETLVGILIIPGAKLQHCFNTQRLDMSTPGNYDLKIWTDLNGDSNVNNDTLFETVINETRLFPDCEDFEGVTDVVGEGGPDLIDGKFSNNWVSNQGDYTWEFGSRTSAPGPNNDHTPTGLGRYMVINNSNGQNGDMAVLTSPCYDLTTVAVANLEFWYHQTGSTNNRLFIDVFDGQLWQNNIDSIIGNGPGQTNTGSPWRLKRVSLANYTGNFVNVRFRAFKLGGTYALDDICVVPPPPNQAQMVNILRPVDELCFYSTSEKIRVRMKNIGSNDISTLGVRIVVDTNSNAAATVFQPYIDTTVIADPGAAPPFWSPGDLYSYETPFGIDMSYYKTYRFKTTLVLTGDLDATDDEISNYRVTHKEPIQFPYLEGFEQLTCNANGPVYNPIGFKRSTGTYAWRVKCGPDVIGLTGPARDHSRNNNFGRYFVTNASVGDQADVATLETPCFDMTTLNKPTFKFWYHMFGFQMGSLFIDINADNGWVTLDSILGQQQINNGAAWLQRSIDLSAYAGEYAKIRFRSFRGDGGASNMAVDDLFVYDLSQYDIGPVDVVRPGSNNFSCYSDTQSVHVDLLNYGAQDLDFGTDTMVVTVEVLKNGTPWDTLFTEINSDIYYNASFATLDDLPSDSIVRVWVNNSSDGNATFDMSELGSVFTFNVDTYMKRDSVDNNDEYTESITTQIAGGTVSISNNSICNGTIVRLNATGFFGAPKWERKYFGAGGTSFWLTEFSFGSDSAEYVVQPDTTAWYRVRICGSDVVSDSVKVDVTVVDIPDGIHDTICGGGTMTVEAGSNPIFGTQAVNWYYNQNDTTPFKVTNTRPFTHTDVYTVTDTFWLEGVIDSCVSLGRNPVYAVVNPFPVIDLGNPNDTLCQDTNKVLNAGAGFGYTYNWLITSPTGSTSTSDLQTIGINPLELMKDATYKYQVTVTSEFGCATISNEISVLITDSCFVGINEVKFEDKFTVYPNPTTGDVFLSLNDNLATEADLEIKSIDGKVVWSKSNVLLSRSEYKLDLGTLSEGVYFIKVNSERGSIIKKLIKN